jgi:hypothetical protein
VRLILLKNIFCNNTKMSYNIERKSDMRKIQTSVSGLGGVDNININRDPFQSNPEEEQELGMEYLVDPDEPSSERGEGNDSEHDEFQEEYDAFGENPENHHDDFESPPVKSYEEIQQEKSYYLSQLKRLEKKGNVTSRRFTMEHSLEEIRGEVIRIKKEQDMDNSIDYLRQGLMFCVSTIEMADNKYNFGAQLGGWSQNVMGNIESYDSVFEELYDKYSTSVTVMPEIKLISMLAGSAFMYSLQKKMIGPQTSVPPRQREMSGPSIDTDELMRRLNEVDIDDDLSSNSSEESVKITEEPLVKTINVPKKKGRPSKKSL